MAVEITDPISLKREMGFFISCVDEKKEGLK
jgi:hypothetical protein